MDGTVAPWSVNPNFLGIYSSASNVTKQYEKFEIKSINGGGKNPRAYYWYSHFSQLQSRQTIKNRCEMKT